MTDCTTKLLITTSQFSDKLFPLSKKVKAKLLTLDEELINDAVVKKEIKSTDATVKVIVCCQNYFSSILSYVNYH